MTTDYQESKENAARKENEAMMVYLDTLEKLAQMDFLALEETMDFLV